MFSLESAPTRTEAALVADRGLAGPSLLSEDQLPTELL